MPDSGNNGERSALPDVASLDVDVRQEASDNLVMGGLIQVGSIGRDLILQLPKQSTPALGGLPSSSPVFKGRAEDFNRLVEALDPQSANTHGLIHVVTGMPGVGKTELVLQVAAHVRSRRDWYSGGVLFVDLFGYSDDGRMTPEAALAGFLRALGLPAEHIPPGLQDRARLYVSVLGAYADAGRPILVILDNASTADDVKALLPSDERTPVLITSRHSLAGIGARLHELTALDDPGATALLQGALDVARGQPDTRVADEPEHAAAITRLCGRLPLALHIVAALLSDQPSRPLAAMAHDLAAAKDDRLEELQRDDLAVRVAFDLSYRRLDEQHALLFRLLPVNPGPDISTSAASALLNSRESVTRRTLESLQRAHLIEPASEYGRWRLHDLLRLYASEHGNAAREEDRRDDASRRLLRFYADLLKEAHTEIRNETTSMDCLSSREAAMQCLEAEKRNLVATVAWTTKAQLWSYTLPLALRLSDFLKKRRYLDEWRFTASAAVLAGEHLGEPGRRAATLNLGLALALADRHTEALTCLQRSLALHMEASDATGQAETLNTIGVVHMDLGQLDDAMDLLRRSAELFAAAGDAHAAAKVQVNLGICLAKQGHDDEAAQVFRDCARVCRDVDDVRGEASALLNLMSLSHEAGTTAEALEICRRAVTVFRQDGDVFHEATALLQLGKALTRARKDNAEAEQTLKQALTGFRGTRDRSMEAEAMGALGDFYREAGKHRKAIQFYRDAESMFAELNDTGGHGRMQIGMATTFSAMRRPADAVDAYRKAAGLLRAAGDPKREAGAWLGLAAELRPMGRPRDAIEATHEAAVALSSADDSLENLVQATLTVLHFALRDARSALDARAIHREALRLFEPLPRLEFRAKTLLSIGMLDHAKGRLTDAEAHLRTAEDLFRVVQNRHLQAAALTNLGGCLADQGRYEPAIAACEQAARLYREEGDANGEAEVLTNLGGALLGAGRLEEALEAAKTAFEIFGALKGKARVDTAMNNLGSIYFQLGQPQEAERWWRRAIRAGSAEAAVNLAAATTGGFASGQQ